MDEKQVKWDRRFLELARFVSSWSKDPSTKTGAVITDCDNRIISLGYNGFAKGVSDFPEDYANREIKYSKVVHCEMNAILFAGRPLKGCTLYTYPFQSCSRCCVCVIQSGITRCVAPPLPTHLIDRWGKDVELAKQMFRESGITMDFIEID